MSDIVERLRAPIDGWSGDAEAVDADTAAEAATEIERLRELTHTRTSEWDEARAEIEQLRIALHDIALMKMPWQLMPDRARAALRGKSWRALGTPSEQTPPSANNTTSLSRKD